MIDTRKDKKEEVVETNPAEDAAYFYHHGIGLVKRYGENLSKKQMLRVLRAVVEFPLHVEKPHLKGQKEEDFFVFYSRLLQARDAIITEAVKQKVNDTKDETKGEDNESGTVD